MNHMDVFCEVLPLESVITIDKQINNQSIIYTSIFYLNEIHGFKVAFHFQLYSKITLSTKLLECRCY